MKALLHSTDWVNHLLFSPTDPQLLMYCHEGPWQKVDRIWMIHTDGTHNTLIHKRTMVMEIAGHEFWGLDGETIWYDWQYPKGEDFFLAGYNLKTGKRTAYHLQRNEWSIHFNLTKDLDLFTGDGGDPGQVAKAPDGEWIELFHPQMLSGGRRRAQRARLLAARRLPLRAPRQHVATTTTARSPTSASRRTRRWSSSPATCSAPATSSAPKSRRPSDMQPTSSLPRSWHRSSTPPIHPTAKGRSRPQRGKGSTSNGCPELAKVRGTRLSP